MKASANAERNSIKSSLKFTLDQADLFVVVFHVFSAVLLQAIKEGEKARFIDAIRTAILRGKFGYVIGFLIIGQQDFPGQGRLSDCAIFIDISHPVGQGRSTGRTEYRRANQTRVQKTTFIPSFNHKRAAWPPPQICRSPVFTSH